VGLGEGDKGYEMCEEKQPRARQDSSARHKGLIDQNGKYKNRWGIRARKDNLLKAIPLARGKL
jgi:hypothetical protein